MQPFRVLRSLKRSSAHIRAPRLGRRRHSRVVLRGRLAEDREMERCIHRSACAVVGLYEDRVGVSIPICGADLAWVRVDRLFVGSPERGQEGTTRHVAIERHLICAGERPREELRDGRYVTAVDKGPADVDDRPERRCRLARRTCGPVGPAAPAAPDGPEGGSPALKSSASSE